MSRVASAFSDFATLPQPNITSEDITEITRLATEIFDSADIKLNFPDKAVMWPIDRTQWIRVMTNLIQNAIQAVPEGVTPLIELTMTVTKKRLNIHVKDNGSGISPEDIPHVFEPKFTTKTGGMGLGLAIVKNIISSFNGRIDFKTTVGNGTTFYIELKR